MHLSRLLKATGGERENVAGKGKKNRKWESPRQEGNLFKRGKSLSVAVNASRSIIQRGSSGRFRLIEGKHGTVIGRLKIYRQVSRRFSFQGGPPPGRISLNEFFTAIRGQTAPPEVFLLRRRYRTRPVPSAALITNWSARLSPTCQTTTTLQPWCKPREDAYTKLHR